MLICINFHPWSWHDKQERYIKLRVNTRSITDSIYLQYQRSQSFYRQRTDGTLENQSPEDSPVQTTLVILGREVAVLMLIVEKERVAYEPSTSVATHADDTLFWILAIVRNSWWMEVCSSCRSKVELSHRHFTEFQRSVVLVGVLWDKHCSFSRRLNSLVAQSSSPQPKSASWWGACMNLSCSHQGEQLYLNEFRVVSRLSCYQMPRHLWTGQGAKALSWPTMVRRMNTKFVG